MQWAKNLRILMTGGTGLIGRKLCALLLAEGHELTVLTRTPASVASKCGPNVHALVSLGQWRPHMAFDAIINLAGEPIVDARWSPQRRQMLWDSRVLLTDQLVRCLLAAEQPPNILLSGSAVGFYGNRGDTDLDEAAAPGQGFAAQLCQAWEQAALSAKALGVRVCLMRTGPVLCRDGGILGRMLPVFRAGLGATLGNGRQWLSWVHIDDYLAMLRYLLGAANANGTYNMTSPHPVTNAQLTSALGTALHRPAPFKIPSLLLTLTLGQRAILLLEGQKALPKRMEASGFHFRFPTLSGALKDLLGE